jgi:hypothetical protein
MSAPATTPDARTLVAVALVSGSLLMTELALTRIFSVTMYYHFAFLAISIALFGLSASGVYVFVARGWLGRRETAPLLAGHAIAFAAATVVAVVALVRIRVGLNYSPANLRLMLLIYTLAALPFFTGGAVIALAISRHARQVNQVYAADLIGAALACLALIPLLNAIGAPGAILAAAAAAAVAAMLFSARARGRVIAAAAIAILPLGLQMATGLFDIRITKGHATDRVLFSRWNSFSRVAVYERGHGDWSLSPTYRGPLPDTRFMDIDSAASTPIVRFTGDFGGVESLRYELTALAYRLRKATAPAVPASPADVATDDGVTRSGESSAVSSSAGGFTALVIGPGGGRDLLSALTFGARHVDGVEINPIIANDVMRGAFREFSGAIYEHPRVTIAVDDGRSFVRRSDAKYDVIQASLVDTWAATAAGAYTLSENSLYTVEAFTDYLDHLADDGVLTITRWVFDGLRLVSLAQEACARRGCDAAAQLAIVQQGRVATFLFKRTPFSDGEVRALKEIAGELAFEVLYAPDHAATPEGMALRAASAIRHPSPPGSADYARLVLARDRHAFYDTYPLDIRPTTDNRPFFFHTTRLRDQFDVAFGRHMLFGNGLSALMTLMAISGGLVVLFVLGPLALTGRSLLVTGWPRWLMYFSCLGAGFMLIEVSVLQQFVLLLGHPVYSLTVTLFSLLLGTGIGSYVSRSVDDDRLAGTLRLALAGIVALAVVAVPLLPLLIDAVIHTPRALRIALAVALLVPAGALMGVPLPAGVRLLSTRHGELVPWAWGMNGALSVVGATLAVFIAMNWGFGMTLVTGAAVYAGAFLLVPRR